MVSYRFYKFVPTETRDSASLLLQMHQLELYASGVGLDLSSSAYGDKDGYPGALSGENVAQLSTSAANSKWLTDTDVGDFAILDCGSETTVDTYDWATAWDEDGRDPVTWQVYGSNSAVLATDTEDATAEWTLLDEQTNYAVTLTREAFVGPFNLTEPAAPPTSLAGEQIAAVSLSWDDDGSTFRVRKDGSTVIGTGITGNGTTAEYTDTDVDPGTDSSHTYEVDRGDDNWSDPITVELAGTGEVVLPYLYHGGAWVGQPDLPRIVKVTQAEYDALTPDSQRLYAIKG